MKIHILLLVVFADDYEAQQANVLLLQQEKQRQHDEYQAELQRMRDEHDKEKVRMAQQCNFTRN